MGESVVDVVPLVTLLSCSGMRCEALSQSLLRVIAKKRRGVMLTELVPAQVVQANFFDNQDRDRALKLMQAMDQINRRWGSGTLKFAAVGLKQQWRLRAEQRSQRYTTR